MKSQYTIIITIIYLITVNIIFPFVGYIITGTREGAMKGFVYGAFLGIPFWMFFGYMLLSPVELLKRFKNM